MGQLAIHLLGGLQVTFDDKPITHFATDKARALLAYLAVRAKRPHRRDALAGLLWPDTPSAKARHNVRQTLSYLRQALGTCGDADTFLLVSRETVQFNPECCYYLDVAEFKHLAIACQEHRHRRLETCPACMRRMAEMTTLYRGEFLAAFALDDSCAFEEWALLEREWLHRQVITSLSHLAHYHERCGDYQRARDYARQQVKLEPWREEAHRQLIRLLALDGQRSAALAQYETCCRVLAEELAVEPTAETTTLVQNIRAEAEKQKITRYPSPDLETLPPAPTPFVGREEELAELADDLVNPDCRWLTIVGPGGIGKTRLALQAAAEYRGAFKHGVYFVPFAAVPAIELIIPTIAHTLQLSVDGQQDLESHLLDYLREKEMLLVLDNLEHLLAGSAVLAKLLRRAPGVVFLATSRERINLQEEWVYELHGLAYPDTTSMQDIDNYSAIELFVQRAQRVWREFRLDAQTLPAAIHICQLVEGMPLGIELAAGWVAVRSCQEIVQDLKNSLDILTTSLRNVPERQQSMRATFEYSWQLFSETEKLLFSRLSVFRGGFRPEAAVQLAGISPVTLSALWDKSLIRRVSSERYDMHELLRQYAAEKLLLYPGEHEQIHTAHARYFAVFLAQQEKRLKGEKQKQALLDISLEIENVRQAWNLAVTRGWASEIEQSQEGLYYFFDIQARFQEGIELFALAIDRWQGDAKQATLLGKILSRQGALYHRLGLYGPARNCLEESLTIFEQAELPVDQVFCLNSLANVARSQGKLDETEKLSQKSMALSRQIKDSRGEAHALFLLGTVRYSAGDVDQADVLLQESLALARERGDQRLMLAPLNTLGDIACYRGDYAGAQLLFNECLSLSQDLGDKFNTAVHLNNLGTVLHILKKYDDAQALYQNSLEICRTIGDQAGQAVALSNLGEIAFTRGAYAEAQAYYREGLAIGQAIQDQNAIMACLTNLGEIACALENYQEAGDYLVEAINLAHEAGILTVLMKALVNMAVLLFRQGQTDRAAMILILARRHPASEQDIQDKADDLLAEIKLAAPELVASVQARSLPLELDAIIAEFLRDKHEM
jgi:predicted ATPase/DNA-binding SARP family transcriptional activator/Tfp pilus assembly protein PilF